MQFFCLHTRWRYSFSEITSFSGCSDSPVLTMQSLISRKWDLIELTDAWNAAAVGCFLLMIQQAHQLHWWESKWLLFGKMSYCLELVAYFSCVHMWLCVQVSAVGSRQHRTPFQCKWGHHQNSVSNCGWRQSTRWGMRQCNFRQVNYSDWSQVAHRDSFKHCIYIQCHFVLLLCTK